MGKNKRMTTIIVAGVLLLTVIGVTVAYFAVSVINGTRQNLSATTVESVNLTLDDNDAASYSGQVSFGSTVTRNLKLTNEGGPTKVALYFQDLINTYTAGAFTYTLSCATTQNGNYTNVLTDVAIPRRSKASSTAKITEIEMPATTTRYYRMLITYNDLEAVDQTRDLTAQFNTGFTIKEAFDATTIIPPGDYLKDFCVEDANGNCSMSYNIFGNTGLSRSYLLTLTTVSSPVPPAGLTYVENGLPWDVSEAQNGSIMAWAIKENVYIEADSTTEEVISIYIGQEGGVVANPNSSQLFIGRPFASMDLSNFKTDYVTNMRKMFSGLSYLASLDLTNLNTSNVTDMSYMFYACYTLNILDLSSFDTSNVTNMAHMFDDTSWPTNHPMQMLDLRSFDTACVTNMSYMFNQKRGLTEIKIGNWDTLNVTDMSYMFSSCVNLEILNVSTFSGENLSNASSMFNACSKIKSIDLSNFEIKSGTKINLMFNGTNALEELKLNKMVFDNITTFSRFLNNTGTSAEHTLQIYVNQNGKNFIDTNFSDYSNNVVLV